VIERVLVDTGPLYAIIDERDEHHSACVDVLQTLQSPLITCWPVLTEAAWLLRGNPPGTQRLLAGFDTGLLSLAVLDEAAAAWIARFMHQYSDLPAQLADAALMYLAERDGVGTVFTLDRRDFSVYRTCDGRALTLLPVPTRDATSPHRSR